jgi:tetratricopeptide (TPR) repeat protein
VWKYSAWSGLGIILACIGGWSQWARISRLPGIEALVERVSEKPLPRAVPGKFNVAIAHLEGDDNHAMERAIRQSLHDDFPGVVTLSFDRLIAFEHGNSDVDERLGHERARALLKESGADVLIWGTLLNQPGKESLPELYWTPSRDFANTLRAGRYQTTADLRLPIKLWQGLTDVVELLVATSEAEFTAYKGRFQTDKLVQFIERVRALLQSSESEHWNAVTRAQVQTLLGEALVIYGEQSGRSAPLLEALAAYREALKERTREKAPLDWAATQNSLGNALRVQGKRESDPAKLTEAIAAYREALKEWTREKVPLDWAATQNNLGGAFLALGARESGPAWLTEAVAAYREALKERTREKVPLDWASTQSNLGGALAILGARESDPARLKEAVAAYREALKEYTREKVPLDWAATQNNLGIALETLGALESNPARLMDAVAAYREALKEWTREKVPLDWAGTQNNLGVAFRVLGALESDPAWLTEAVAAYRQALKERTREKVPLDWAATQNNLGIALETLGAVESDPARLEEALRAFQDALVVFRAAKADYYTHIAGENLQRVQKQISQQKRARGEAGETATRP